MLEVTLALASALKLAWALAHDVVIEVAGDDPPQLHCECDDDAIAVLQGQMLGSPCSSLPSDCQRELALRRC